MKKKAPHECTRRSGCEANFKDSSTSAQRQRLIDALAASPQTTQQVRNELDILHPAGRIRELRRAGHNIHTFWEVIETFPGARHRIARYVLFPGQHDGRVG